MFTDDEIKSLRHNALTVIKRYNVLYHNAKTLNESISIRNSQIASIDNFNIIAAKHGFTLDIPHHLIIK